MKKESAFKMKGFSGFGNESPAKLKFVKNLNEVKNKSYAAKIYKGVKNFVDKRVVKNFDEIKNKSYLGKAIKGIKNEFKK